MSNKEKIQIQINGDQMKKELEGDFFAGLTLTNEGNGTNTQYAMNGTLGFQETLHAAKGLRAMADRLLGELPIPKGLAEEMLKDTSDFENKDTDESEPESKATDETSSNSPGKVKVFSVSGADLPEGLAKLLYSLLTDCPNEDRK